MKRACFYATQIGNVGIAEENGAVTNVFFGNTAAPKLFEEEETELLRRAAKQLAEYLNEERQEFDLPINPEGTQFEREVWSALREIPYGETCSYGELAMAIGRPNASRAVGRANSRNPISLIIPCHRVIGADGRLTGYAGGLAIKEQLLLLESRGKALL